MLTEAECKDVVQKKGLKSCRDLEYNWLGTDDQGRDVVARLIYGFRISVLFGLSLTIISSIIGVAAGGVQGYFGGKIDLYFQRIIEIWSAIPSLYLLMILSNFFAPSFFTLLGILLLFSWVALVHVVRAEFLRARNFDYVRAARALGLTDAELMPLTETIHAAAIDAVESASRQSDASRRLRERVDAEATFVAWERASGTWGTPPLIALLTAMARDVAALEKSARRRAN